MQPRMPPARRSDLADAILTSLVMVGVLFLVFGAEAMLGLPRNRFGIQPRTGAGLVGVVTSPLLHASLSHLTANAAPLLVMLVLLLSDRAYHPGRTLAWIWIGSGLGTWLIGRGGDAVHIGASGIIFGLAAFLIVAGFSMKSWRSAVVAILVFVIYGGIFYGLLPQAGPISWEGHLCGALAGIWAARNLR